MDEESSPVYQMRVQSLNGTANGETGQDHCGKHLTSRPSRVCRVKGRDIVKGIPKVLTIDSEQVRTVMFEQLDAIIQTVRIALEQTTPELSADAVGKPLN